MRVATHNTQPASNAATCQHKMSEEGKTALQSPSATPCHAAPHHTCADKAMLCQTGSKGKLPHATLCATPHNAIRHTLHHTTQCATPNDAPRHTRRYATRRAPPQNEPRHTTRHATQRATPHNAPRHTIHQATQCATPHNAPRHTMRHATHSPRYTPTVFFC